MKQTALQVAQAFVKRPVPYTFTPTEEQSLLLFCSNLNRHLFLLDGLPANVNSALASMYSRLKNPRGLRGVIVDTFIPGVLAAQLEEVMNSKSTYQGNAEAFIRDKKIKTLDGFMDYSPEAAGLYAVFLQNAAMDPEYKKHFADSGRVKRFLSMWLDKYGHNSIARMASFVICYENISLHAAKTLEWVRPGAGFVELSTRYVDMYRTDMYPIWDELATYGADASEIETTLRTVMNQYRVAIGDNLDGEFPTYLRTERSKRFEGEDKDFEVALSGEVYDVLGNLLPLTVLTSVAVTISGESFQQLLRHFLLDSTPENQALLELTLEEAEKTGAIQFARHFEPTQSQTKGWSYYSPTGFESLKKSMIPGEPGVKLISNQDSTEVEQLLLRQFQLKQGFETCTTLKKVHATLFANDRHGHDKLPSVFESGTDVFEVIMTMRSWRDLQRQSLSSHHRTYLTPDLGFYEYPKPHPTSLDQLFAEVSQETAQLYKKLRSLGIPEISLQYLLPIGFNLGVTFAANWAQYEFCCWQRSKADVNDEVRRVFVEMDGQLSNKYEWWSLFARTDREKGYWFARAGEPMVIA